MSMFISVDTDLSYLVKNFLWDRLLYLACINVFNHFCVRHGPTDLLHTWIHYSLFKLFWLWSLLAWVHLTHPRHHHLGLFACICVSPSFLAPWAAPVGLSLLPFPTSRQLFPQGLLSCLWEKSIRHLARSMCWSHLRKAFWKGHLQALFLKRKHLCDTQVYYWVFIYPRVLEWTELSVHKPFRSFHRHCSINATKS